MPRGAGGLPELVDAELLRLVAEGVRRLEEVPGFEGLEVEQGEDERFVVDLGEGVEVRFVVGALGSVGG